MSHPATTAPTQEIEPNPHEDTIAISDSYTGYANAGRASSKFKKPEEVATTRHGSSEIHGPLKESANFKEALTKSSELSPSNAAGDKVTKGSHVPLSKPVSTHRPTAAGFNSNAPEIHPNNTKNDSGGASDSLLHRLAGPSVGKAGLARDQTDITRVIARASEGSKYYEVSKRVYMQSVPKVAQDLTITKQNERRKNEEVEKKIEGLLKLRDSLRAMADIRASLLFLEYDN